MKLRVPILVAAGFAVMAMAVPSSAEIVYLQSGRTLSVKGHRYDGESIILTLRNGGEITCDRTLVDKILPDEVPYPEPPTAPQARPDEQKTAPRPLETRIPYADIISTVAEAHGVDPVLVAALIQVESGYRPRARSRKGAMGLMQLMPSTAREYKVRNPFDPRANIEAGIKHLKSLIDRFDGAVDLSLAAYNAGVGAVERFNGIPPYRETRNYVSRILSLASSRE